ncbi:HAD-IIIA family hydrolase [Bacillus sp. EB01]|uniref:HAD-IIIA family hydrolase n=1 Tax=Bacillus sp. EB01 TaxID=1347086 RepID=UPI0005C7352A|nr:HAD-IIIA family hydrolase [Bacillus sp. EB01]
MQVQAVFIDRDGTIGGSDNVIYPGEFKLFPNVAESLEQLKRYDMLICSFTNQPGISKGEASLQSFEKELIDFGFDRIYLCPHLHNEGCECRKPSPGMLKKAAHDNKLDLESCIVIGDRWTDLLAADEVGCHKILVKTGNGKAAFIKYVNNEYFGRWAQVKPDFVAEDFKEAVQWIINEHLI